MQYVHLLKYFFFCAFFCIYYIVSFINVSIDVEEKELCHSVLLVETTCTETMGLQIIIVTFS